MFQSVSKSGPNRGDISSSFPNLEFEESKIPELRRKSLNEISSESYSSSETSSEEEEKAIPNNVHVKPNGEFNKHSRRKARKSILKSQLLTTKRESKYKSTLFTPSKASGNLQKFKTETEGRLPIRRPSVMPHILEAAAGAPAFMTKDSNLTMLKPPNEDIVGGGSKEEKGELDYISSSNEEENREDLNSFLSRSLFTNKFQVVWSILLFLAHSYNLLSLFWYLGLPDFPSNELLALQTFIEMLLIID